MIGTTHRAGGILFGATVPLVATHIPYIDHLLPQGHLLPFVAVTMAGGAIGSLFPDIDHKGSMVSKKAKILNKVAENFVSHRGGTHSLLGLIVYSVLALIFSSSIVSFITHSSVTNIGRVDVDIPVIIASIIETLIVTSAIFFTCHMIEKHFKIKKLVRNLPCKKKDKFMKLFKSLFLKQNLFLISILITLAVFLISMTSQGMILSYIPAYLIGTAFGYASHLFLDSFTVSGVPLFLPCKGDYGFKLVKTGEHEKEVTAICTVLTIIVLVLVFI